jgi:hypothetical protein
MIGEYVGGGANGSAFKGVWKERGGNITVAVKKVLITIIYCIER